MGWQWLDRLLGLGPPTPGAVRDGYGRAHLLRGLLGGCTQCGGSSFQYIPGRVVSRLLGLPVTWLTGQPSYCLTCGLTLWEIRWQRVARATVLTALIGPPVVLVVIALGHLT